ncbi:hypothetical protein JCM24511_08984 [Saitozyma sp. JCM 24511]|nr:hypothetical protein JCM24511_08984 [Saitozyma sp. JCM 24511]
MGAEVEHIARRIVSRFRAHPESERLVVGVAGIPGSGKSTVAYPLTDRVNELLRGKSTTHDVAVCVPVDGWHYSLEELRAMPDSAHMLARRGAHFTFDAESFRRFVISLSSTDSSIAFPTFSHAAKDPEEGGHVTPANRIIILEGLYSFLDIPIWRDAASRLHERIWIDTPWAVARERLLRRHISEGVSRDWTEASQRVDQSDRLNAEFLQANLMNPTVVVTAGSTGGTVTEGSTDKDSETTPASFVRPPTALLAS